jgi:hypothetical protein
VQRDMVWQPENTGGGRDRMKRGVLAFRKSYPDLRQATCLIPPPHPHLNMGMQHEARSLVHPCRHGLLVIVHTDPITNPLRTPRAPFMLTKCPRTQPSTHARTAPCAPHRAHQHYLPCAGSLSRMWPCAMAATRHSSPGELAPRTPLRCPFVPVANHHPGPWPSGCSANPPIRPCQCSQCVWSPSGAVLLPCRRPSLHSPSRLQHRPPFIPTDTTVRVSRRVVGGSALLWLKTRMVALST